MCIMWKKILEFIVKFGDCKDWTYICTKLPPYMLSSLIKETRWYTCKNCTELKNKLKMYEELLNRKTGTKTD